MHWGWIEHASSHSILACSVLRWLWWNESVKEGNLWWTERSIVKSKKVQVVYEAWWRTCWRSATKTIQRHMAKLPNFPQASPSSTMEVKQPGRQWPCMHPSQVLASLSSTSPSLPLSSHCPSWQYEVSNTPSPALQCSNVLTLKQSIRPRSQVRAWWSPNTRARRVWNLSRPLIGPSTIRPQLFSGTYLTAE